MRLSARTGDFYRDRLRPSIWQLVSNLLTWGTLLSEEEGSMQMDVPV
jgi:hypothetical protein